MGTLTFGGCAMVKTNPTFVEQCLIVASMVERFEDLPWKDGYAGRKFGRLTVNIGPDRNPKSLMATVAWRNEVFACMFPVDEEKIGIGAGWKGEKAQHYDLTWACEKQDAVKSKLIELLQAHLKQRKERHEELARSSSEALAMLD